MSNQSAIISRLEFAPTIDNPHPPTRISVLLADARNYLSLWHNAAASGDESAVWCWQFSLRHTLAEIRERKVKRQ